MNPGNFKRTLIIQRSGKVQDEELNWIEGFETIATIRGSLTGTLKDSETMIAGAMGSKSPKKFRAWYRPFIKRGMRILMKSGQDEKGDPMYRKFDVLDYSDVEEKGIYMDILCEEVD
ncbi:head-tail adaptor protein [Bacillus atrophaeus]|uniref:head-tail adaptor protein n=1 Tax=Bacillus atrophaeus TaxID=1452 RepID=UPI00255C1B7D|nr:head-tail adaptor protein [Bacillus atrophaeus]MDL5141125.1 head-tail adaptor protein [Bacillus atrophaeus]